MERAFSMLIHGAAKSGKSSLSVTGPTPRLYMDVESAARFLPIRPIEWDPAREPPPEPGPDWDTAIVPTRDWGVVEKAYQWLASGQHPFNSVVVDSISELQQRYIESQAGRQQLTQQHWGTTFRVVAGLIRDLRDLTMHPTRPVECVVMTAMTKQIDGTWRPHLQGQAATMLPYTVDVVGYLWADQVVNELTGEAEEVRKLLTRRTAQFEAGERVNGRLPTVIDIVRREPFEPGDDITRMIDAIFGPRRETPPTSADAEAVPTTNDTHTEEPTPT